MKIKKIDIPESTAIDASVLWGGINDNMLAAKINELIDVVNKQQDIIRQIGEWGSSKGECLWCDTLTEFNPEKPTISKMEKVETPAENVQPDAESRPENVQDKFAEQRQWIGKVCWFWDDDNANSSCGILTSIDTETFKEPQFVCNDEYDYEHCRPVSPDDDIIYKGGDNEK